MKLNIPIKNNNKVEGFLLFDLDRKGIKIKSNPHAEDLFILKNAYSFKVELEKL